MKTVYSPLHARHDGHTELIDGAIVPGFEKPSRVEFIRTQIEESGLGEIAPPTAHDLSAALRVHDARYVDFLQAAWPMWSATGHTIPAMPFAWPRPGLRSDVRPTSIDALLGFYSFDAGTTFVAGTWEAIRASYDVALSAAALVQTGESAFALCRPPGHHAGTDFLGGYCYLNNAAIAVQQLLDAGASRVAVLDVDYHHGNGTQQIFYARGDVLVVNLHADPLVEYPFFLGHADERGVAAGEGFTANFPMPAGTGWDRWGAALDDACARLTGYSPDAVVVSLGVDTFENDPISSFALTTGDYPKMGRRIGQLGFPTLFVMEGGYAVEEIGVNVVGVLTGFEDA